MVKTGVSTVFHSWGNLSVVLLEVMDGGGGV